jgi:hypothetical protein
MNKKAVILGMGRMGREHERAYRECHVEVVHTTTREDPDWYSNGIDYVSVCTHDDTHAAYIIDALEAGHKVIAEKPLCLTEDDLRRIYKLATPENLTCNLPLLHLDWPDGKEAVSLMADYFWGRADRISGWRSQCPGYSFVLGAGVHLASLLIRLKGRAIEYVEADGLKSNPEIACETVIRANGRFVGGDRFKLMIDCSSLGKHEHTVAMSFNQGRSTIFHRDSDKTAEPRFFIESGIGNHYNSFAAHSVCFAIERALKSGKRETVEYLT